MRQFFLLMSTVAACVFPVNSQLVPTCHCTVSSTGAILGDCVEYTYSFSLVNGLYCDPCHVDYEVSGSTSTNCAGLDVSIDTKGPYSPPPAPPWRNRASGNPRATYSGSNDMNCGSDLDIRISWSSGSWIEWTVVCGSCPQ